LIVKEAADSKSVAAILMNGMVFVITNLSG
jgi:hypothetical protein